MSALRPARAYDRWKCGCKRCPWLSLKRERCLHTGYPNKPLRRACNTDMVCDVGTFAMHHQRFVEAFVVLCVAR